MKIKETKVTPFEARWLCGQDNCDGEMEPTGEFYPMFRTYNYMCSKCYRTQTSTEIYPKIIYKALG